MRAQRDPDVLLVESMLAPPPLEDARRSLEYWQRRRQALPLYQRRARREAREMATRWDARVRAAERARFEASVLGRVVVALGLSWLFELRQALTKRRLIALAWGVVPRRVKLVAGALTAAWLLLAIGVVGVAAAALTHLA